MIFSPKFFFVNPLNKHKKTNVWRPIKYLRKLFVDVEFFEALKMNVDPCKSHFFMKHPMNVNLEQPIQRHRISPMVSLLSCEKHFVMEILWRSSIWILRFHLSSKKIEAAHTGHPKEQPAIIKAIDRRSAPPLVWSYTQIKKQKFFEEKN